MTRYLPGDIVSRRKGIVMHKGVVLADGSVLHNTPFRGEHVTTPEAFRAGRRLHVTRQPLDARQRALRAARADERRGYHLITNNCEHTVSRAAEGTPRSPQLRGWVAGIAVAGVTFALTRHPGLTAAGYALGRSLAKRL